MKAWARHKTVGREGAKGRDQQPDPKKKKVAEKAGMLRLTSIVIAVSRPRKKKGGAAFQGVDSRRLPIILPGAEKVSSVPESKHLPGASQFGVLTSGGGHHPLQHLLGPIPENMEGGSERLTPPPRYRIE